jgi:xanthine dehydrogenase YagS FAD-binding subunit
MKAFEYATALSTDSARELVAGHGAYLAGGNDPARPAEGISRQRPDILVNIKSLPGLGKIEPGKKFWTIGSLVTVGGNRAQRPGLQKFFRACTTPRRKSPRRKSATWPPSAAISRSIRAAGISAIATRSASRKSGDLCYARNGENRYHSLFTGNTCISPVVSSLATTFAALDATAIVLRDGKETRMSMAELYHRAWENPLAHNSLDNGDLILRVEIPTVRSRSAYLQVSDKHAFDWALVSCAAAAEVVDGKLKSPRVALGSISPVPHQVEAANSFLDGKTLDDATASQAADMILAGATPLEHNGYKVPMAHALIRRTLLKLKG